MDTPKVFSNRQHALSVAVQLSAPFTVKKAENQWNVAIESVDPVLNVADRLLAWLEEGEEA